MCFSAEVSFGASAVLGTVGIISIYKSANNAQRLFSCIPIIFAVQQFSEGILWLSSSYAAVAPYHNVATYTFLVFAQVIWPFVVPLSVMQMETDLKRKRMLKYIVLFGSIFSSYLIYCLIFYKVESYIDCSHIKYDMKYPIRFKFSGIIYLIPTILPLILSTIKRTRLLGIVILVSYIITKLFYTHYLISIWCFFAAIISILVLHIIIKLNNTRKYLS